MLHFYLFSTAIFMLTALLNLLTTCLHPSSGLAAQDFLLLLIPILSIFLMQELTSIFNLSSLTLLYKHLSNLFPFIHMCTTYKYIQRPNILGLGRHYSPLPSVPCFSIAKYTLKGLPRRLALPSWLPFTTSSTLMDKQIQVNYSFKLFMFFKGSDGVVNPKNIKKYKNHHMASLGLVLHNVCTIIHHPRLNHHLNASCSHSVRSL